MAQIRLEHMILEILCSDLQDLGFFSQRAADRVARLVSFVGHLWS